jgi:hypothetical protein
MTIVDRALLVLLGALLGSGCDEAKTESTKAPSKVAAEVGPPTQKAVETKAPPPAPTPTTPPPPVVEAAKAAPPPAVKTTPEVKALDETLAPILAIADDDARSKAGCKALDTINAQIRAIDRHPPAGVDPMKWTEVVEQRSGWLNDFAIECAEDSSANTKALTDLAELRKDLDTLMPK